jgi:hypothetical protein
MDLAIEQSHLTTTDVFLTSTDRHPCLCIKLDTCLQLLGYNLVIPASTQNPTLLLPGAVTTIYKR